VGLPAGISVQWAPVPPGTARRGIAWGLLRTLVGEPDASITSACPHCGGPHGPVRIDGAGAVASVSYAGGFAIVCLAEETVAASVGVDAEAVSDPRRNATAMRGIIHPGRSSSLREWTRVEAVLKADGRGLRVDPAAVALTEGNGQWNAMIAGSDRRFIGWDVAGPPGILVSIAAEPR
jgi:4'-phosphopantetheinyl transferase